MAPRSRAWLVGAVVFSAINAAGVVFAAAQGELLHTGAHVALLLVGVYVVRRLVPGRIDERDGGESSPLPSELSLRLTHLEQALDAVAIEVERIGEGQRFLTRSFAQRGAPQPPAAEPGERGSGEQLAYHKRGGP